MLIYGIISKFRTYDAAAFMRNERTDFKGRMYLEILERDDEYLEKTHDYIQVLFPTDEKSKYLAVPVLERSEIYKLSQDKIIIENLCKATGRMLAFYLATNAWLSENNHNFKRISRIVRCLCLFGMKSEAEMFLSKVKPIFMKCDKISDECKQNTLNYWKENLEV